MLTDKIRVEQSAVQDPEDFFGEATSGLFADETRNSHGYPEATLIYESVFGDIRLSVTEPDSEDDRNLFAHYLWNASIYCAGKLESKTWIVTDRVVLELGAGLGLCGIVASICGASRVVLSDYPANKILDNISRNVTANVPLPAFSNITVAGHVWGDFSDDLSKSECHSFSTILVCDCYWMPWLHRALAKSMLHFLSYNLDARVYAVGGFHTGRANLAPFFSVAEEEGLDVESIEEVDVFGTTRSWVTERDGGIEHVLERKRWLVVAVLKRKSSNS